MFRTKSVSDMDKIRSKKYNKNKIYSPIPKKRISINKIMDNLFNI